MKPTLFFLDGTVLLNGNIALAAQYNEYADVEASRVLLKLDDDWLKVDFDDDVIRSLAFSAPTGTLYLLGTSGVVYAIGGREVMFSKLSIKGTLRKQQVIEPEDRGELFRLRAFGDIECWSVGREGKYSSEKATAGKQLAYPQMHITSLTSKI